MPATSSLGELLTTILGQRPFLRAEGDAHSIEILCRTLLSQTSEKTGVQIAGAILEKYPGLKTDEKLEFFRFLKDDFDLERESVAELASRYSDEPTASNYAKLTESFESKRQTLFRRLNETAGATSELVHMRVDLLSFLKDEPELRKVDRDLAQLLKSWFNPGFLVLRQINWESSAALLEKVIAYEAVHEIQTWDDLRRRLQPDDRQCYAFFHPSMPEEPLIFVEVALTNGVPNSIQDLLSDSRTAELHSKTDTAVFYSISNCQTGLAGISFGNSLIKQVARTLSRDFPSLKTFITLSPIPGLSRWVSENEFPLDPTDETTLKQVVACYLTESRTSKGQPLDPVAKFHLSNGAQIHAIHALADVSENGMRQSYGAMVNYLYDLKKISANVQRFSEDGAIAASGAVKSLARQASKQVDTV